MYLYLFWHQHYVHQWQVNISQVGCDALYIYNPFAFRIRHGSGLRLIQDKFNIYYPFYLAWDKVYY